MQSDSAFRGFQGEEVLKEDADKEQKEPDELSSFLPPGNPASRLWAP